MIRFIHRLNVDHYQKLLAETTDEARRQTLLSLLAEEKARSRTKPLAGTTLKPLQAPQ